MCGSKVLRISVTDRCDLRCVYCMPEAGVPPVSHGDLLSYEEIETVARAAQAAGVRRFRVTGGEPLVRRGVERLVGMLAALRPDDLALTTNGTHLEEAAAGLKAAGLGRVTVSLDTLRPERFAMITRRTGLDKILAGIRAARAAGLAPVKVNTVVIRGVNDDELGDFVRFGRAEGVEVRFIELMPTSGLSPECKELGSWRPALHVKGSEILAAVEREFGPAEKVETADGVASIFCLDDGTRFGIISPISEPFCRGCERLRLSADGRLKLCLFDREGLDLKAALRARKATESEITALVLAALKDKEGWDRGSLQTLSSDMFKTGG